MAVNGNALIAFAYFIKQGLTPAQSAGIVGNFMQESGVDPGSTNASEGAIGLAQWEGGRRTALANYASSIGQSMTSIYTQLGFAWQELNSSESAALGALKATTTPAAAATVFANDYERCGNCVMSARIANANAVYSNGTGNLPPVGSTALASATGQSSSSSSSSDCVFQLSLPSLGPIGGGSICFWHQGWSRAFLGGLLLAMGGGLMLTGVVTLVVIKGAQNPTIANMAGIFAGPVGKAATAAKAAKPTVPKPSPAPAPVTPPPLPKPRPQLPKGKIIQAQTRDIFR